MLIYYAGPLFSKAEQAFNLRLNDRLVELGFTVFLPQRDGVEIADVIAGEIPIEELWKTIFAVDRDKVLESDIFIFILDGRVPDEGACVELGIAYTQKYLKIRDKLIVGLHTDMRAAFPDAKLNPMISGSFDEIVHDENTLIAFLEKYRNQNEQ